MILKNVKTIAFAAAAGLALLGCGGSTSKASTTSTVVAAQGATLTAGAATLTIPAGALTKDTAITLREADPQHASRAARVEIQPHDALAAGHEAHLSVKVSNSNPKVKMHNGSDDSLEDVEVDDRNHHSFKTNMSTLGDFEVEVEDGAACTATCSSTQECDDGVCKDHHGEAKACDKVCDTGMECDDGTCKTHVEFETEHGAPGTDTHACSPTCDAPLVCHDGTCSAHG